MIIHTLRYMLVDHHPAAPASLAMPAGEALSMMDWSPLLGVVGLCLVGLLVFWILRFTGHPRWSRFRRRRSRKGLSEMAAYDHVTGLPTKRLFVTLLEHAIGRAAQTGRALAVVVVELEHFRMVAESQGVANSNVLARVQAARVKGVLTSTSTVARLMQDQFAMVADNLVSPADVAAIVAKLQATVGLPLTLEGHELFMTFRIGVAMYPRDAADPARLIDQAVQAVKLAKSEGQVVRFFSPPVLSPVSDPITLAS
ncbi:MAG: GGDEF domain-containing protein [Nitrospira sp.]|nr:GGDEF domain-containing protein [Nitrospira sp.]